MIRSILIFLAVVLMTAATAVPTYAQTLTSECLIANHNPDAEQPMRQLIKAKMDKQPRSATRSLERRVASLLVAVAIGRCSASIEDLRSPSFKTASQGYAKWLAAKVIADGLN